MEIGHEYFGEETDAPGKNLARARQELELRCDGVAILTLLQLGLDPASVVSAARKLASFNERRGIRIDSDPYPSTAERRQFTRAMVRLVQTVVPSTPPGPGLIGPSR